jgi:hypothetical protein
VSLLDHALLEQTRQALTRIDLNWTNVETYNCTIVKVEAITSVSP